MTGYAIHELYDWDLYFETLFLSHFGIAKSCRNNVETFLDIQEENGYISRAAVTVRKTQHFKPFLAQTALLGSRQRRDFRWLAGERYYPRLKKYLDHWFSDDRDGNGLPVWDGSDQSGMGSTWIPTNYMVFRGLIRYGYTEIARELADKTFELVVSEADLREYYNGETGAGQGCRRFGAGAPLATS